MDEKKWIFGVAKDFIDCSTEGAGELCNETVETAGIICNETKKANSYVIKEIIKSV